MLEDHANSSLRILVVDDHAVVRSGIEALLATVPEVSQSASAESSIQAFELCESFDPHVVILDIRMAGMDGMSALEVINQQWPHVRVIVLTGFDSVFQVALARKNGASGFVSKCEPPGTLIQALRTVVAGETFFPDGQTHTANPILDGITIREVEVLRQLGRGYTNEEIGNHLGIAAQTVKGHLKNLFPKLQASNRAEAVARAHDLGIL